MNKQSLRNSFLLFLAAAIWGMAFVSQSKGMEYMGPLTFNGVRCLIGAVSLVIYIAITCKTGSRELSKVNWKATIRAGLWCGLLLTTASTLQQFGMVYTTVGKAGFITTLYIIFVPIAGIFFRRRVGGMVWLAAALAAVGMYLLCMTESFALSSGDTLVFLCAVVFTAHIMVIDHYADHVDGVIVSCIQFTIAGLVCTVGALLFEEPTFAALGDGIVALLYAGVMSCGIAYTLQIVGQKGVNPTVAALILSLESVVATVAGVVAFKIGLLKTDQTMAGRQIAGCVLVFVGVILVQLPWDKWFGRKVHNE
jgi:drug/metabolite transporter (DMT)-like permease